MNICLLACVDLKNNAQHESCELSFICGKMRTTAQETAAQIALRNCSKVIGKTDRLYVILVKGESSTYFFIESFCCSREASAGLVKLLLVMRNSRHHEGFLCFSGYEEIQELGS